MAENLKEKGCPQKDSAEHEEYVGASRSFRRIWEERNRVQPERLIRFGFYDLAEAYQSVHATY